MCPGKGVPSALASKHLAQVHYSFPENKPPQSKPPPSRTWASQKRRPPPFLMGSLFSRAAAAEPAAEAAQEVASEVDALPCIADAVGTPPAAPLPLLIAAPPCASSPWPGCSRPWRPAVVRHAAHAMSPRPLPLSPPLPRSPFVLSSLAGISERSAPADNTRSLRPGA